MKQRANGFTIVELLIVIVVIAILAAISVVAYNGIQDRARKSALASQLSQTEKEIMAWALAKNGESISLSGTMMGYQVGAGQSNLLNPIVGATDMTMYMAHAFVDQSANYQGLAYLGPSLAGSQVFLLDTNSPGDSIVRYRIDTSATSNAVASQGNIRNAGARIVGWLQTSNNATTRSFAYNQSASHNTASLVAHSNWNFTSIGTTSSSGGTTLAALLFRGAHNQTTRSQVLGWLAEKYSVPGTY